MKIKKIILCVMLSIAALFSFAGCAKDSSAEDAALAERLIGGWVPLNDEDEVRDEDGNITAFGVYEFTGTKTYFYLVANDRTETYDINEYVIKDGLYKVVEDGAAQNAKIKFTDSGNLLWITDGVTDEFRPLTDEEKTKFAFRLSTDPDEFENDYDWGDETAVRGAE